MLAAVFAFLAGFILSLDVRNFPERIASMPALGAEIKPPREIIWLVYSVLVVAKAAGAARPAVAALADGKSPVRVSEKGNSGPLG